MWIKFLESTLFQVWLLTYLISASISYAYSSFLMAQARKAYRFPYKTPASLWLRSHRLMMDLAWHGVVDKPVTRGVIVMQRWFDLLPGTNTLMLLLTVVVTLRKGIPELFVRTVFGDRERMRAWLDTPT